MTLYKLAITPDNGLPWSVSHAMMPTPFQIDKRTCRIFYGTRNSKNQSHITYRDISLKDRKLTISEQPKAPCLAPGRLGCFDDNGVLPSSVLVFKNWIYLFYVGFKPGGTTRMDLFGGVARKDKNSPNATFERISEAPIIERISINPYINTAPFVIPYDDHFLMYYVAGTRWENPDKPNYNIQMAYSQDLLHWDRRGEIAIDYIGEEFALARPFVKVDDTGYEMFFSSKTEERPSYLPHIAYSSDGKNWQRISQEHVLNTSFPFHNTMEMICYPVRVTLEDRNFILFNSTDYGRYGIDIVEV